MNKRIPELLIIFALFVLPLLHSSIEDSFLTRRMWSWCIVLSTAIIAFFVSYPFRVQKIFSSITPFTVVFLVSSFLLALYPANALAIYFVILAISLFLAVQIILKRDPNNYSIFVVVLLGFFSMYAQWGIVQFIIQRDLGMVKIGESFLTQNTAGVASFYIGSEKFIRAYGPFAHANSFAGVLLLGIIILYQQANKFRSALFYYGVFFVISLGIITSFSRNALIGLLVLVFFFVFKKRFLLLLPLGTLVVLFLPLLFHRSFDTHGTAAYERFVGFQWFVNIMNIDVLIRGIGIGNYTTVLRSYLENNTISYHAWDIAPIHSVPLFLIAELGLIIVIPLIIVLTRHIYVHKLWIVIVLTPAIFFDHYFATQLAPFIFLITTAYLVVY